MISWFAVYTQPGKEKLAAQHLQNQGFGVYLPQYQKMRRHAGRTEIVAAPLFPRYLFAGIDMEAQRWRSVNGTRGVVGLVMSGDKPIPVPEPVIAEIRAREDDKGFIRLNPPQFRPGQTLRVVEGPMADTQALFEEAVDGNRAILLVSLLGRLVRTQMPLRAVEAA
ncbi:MAG TPA: transcription termination/antitermination NusG family protein [Ferrovibrio sp.]|jgi:transcriptional antiterminator RfaH|uniref:transcription termination/antitermination protein NusG n=1 Tax=Ferrovibrio sp. TaxID=1917215 RepID=UPI002B4B5DFC|nr:transcription termination/antitermination NusG family protein [Ferrovibrio sp.]HLT78534.1 transcription termination/antitermination NusG family protein [Ferrovibrio sp.]